MVYMVRENKEVKQFKSIRGLANSIRYALRRQGLPVSVWYNGRLYHKRTDGVYVEAVDGFFSCNVKLELYNCDIPMENVVSALQQEGFKVESKQKIINGHKVIEYFVNGTKLIQRG